MQIAINDNDIDEFNGFGRVVQGPAGQFLQIGPVGFPGRLDGRAYIPFHTLPVRIEMTGYVRIKALGHQKKVIFILQGDPDAVSQVVSAQVFPHDAEPGEDIIDISHNNNSFFMVHCNYNKTKSGNMQGNFTRKKEKCKIIPKILYYGNERRANGAGQRYSHGHRAKPAAWRFKGFYA